MCVVSLVIIKFYLLIENASVIDKQINKVWNYLYFEFDGFVIVLGSLKSVLCYLSTLSLRKAKVR